MAKCLSPLISPPTIIAILLQQVERRQNNVIQQSIRHLYVSMQSRIKPFTNVKVDIQYNFLFNLPQISEIVV